MARFVGKLFVKDGDCYQYPVANGAYRFVARFKYGRAGWGDFKKFLMANFQVEEYFALYDQGIAPLLILERKGYVHPNIRRICARHGYPQTKAGWEACFAMLGKKGFAYLGQDSVPA
jgi:hypothetical protein